MYKKGYIASPLNAPTRKGIEHNMKLARRYEYVLNYITGTRNRAIQGYVPALLDDHIPEERELGLKMGLELLNQSDAIILCGNRLSIGMKNELQAALIDQKAVYVLKGKVTMFKPINILLCIIGKLSLHICPYSEAKLILLKEEI